MGSRAIRSGNRWTTAVAHKLRFHVAIPDDLINALDYYDTISNALGNRFRENVERRLDDIASHPEAFPFDEAPIRFAKVDRFPQLIFFAVESEVVQILAIVHGASDPEKWRTRI